jgi:hypothetical protein
LGGYFRQSGNYEAMGRLGNGGIRNSSQNDSEWLTDSQPIVASGLPVLPDAFCTQLAHGAVSERTFRVRPKTFSCIPTSPFLGSNPESLA